jgi:hypothetical protein
MTHTKDEALKLALEALRLYQRTLAPADTQCRGVAAVAAIEQTLAATTVQEPVAVLNHAHGVYAFRSVNLQGLPDGEYQVYTTTPTANKPWVGLTDDLITEIWETHPYFNDFARTIEAKLKALNYPTGNYPIVDN